MLAATSVCKGSDIKLPTGRGPENMNEIAFAGLERHQAPDNKAERLGPAFLKIGCGGWT